MERNGRAETLQLQLSGAERSALDLHSALVGAWGFRVVDDRLVCAPALCGHTLTPADLKQFLAALAEHGPGLETDGSADDGSAAPMEAASEFSTASDRARVQLRWRCRPPAVDRILMSRACRSAVKFGDALSMEQMRAIVSRLAACRFPFQCAHGRPTSTPLATLATVSTAAEAELPAALTGAASTLSASGGFGMEWSATYER
jgi:DNA mismatch repair ATPase MutL